MKKYLLIFLFSFFILIPNVNALEQNYSIDVFSFTYQETSGIGCPITSKTTTLSNNFTQFISFYDSDYTSCSAPSLAKTIGMNVTTPIQSGYYYTITERLYFNGAIEYLQDQVNTYTQCGVYNGTWNMNACENVVVSSTAPQSGYVDIKIMFKSNISGSKYTLTIGSLNTGYSMFYTVNAGGQFRLDNLIVEGSPDPILGAIGSIGQQNNTIIEQNKETNEKLEGIDSSIKDDNVNVSDDTISDLEGFLPENGVITQLITLPLSLYQHVLNSINSSCSDFSLGTLYGTELIIPCFTLDGYFGSFWNILDLMISGFFVYTIAKKMIAVFNNMSNLEEGDILD